MPQCPVCDTSVNADQKAYEHHVNAHFDGPSHDAQIDFTNASGPVTRPISGQEGWQDEAITNDSQATGIESCPICDFPMSFLTPIETQSHIESCFGDPSLGVEDQYMDPEDVDFDYTSANVADLHAQDDGEMKEWDGPVRPGGWSGWVGRKAERGDRWWDPVHGSVSASDIPSNFSPGIISVLAAALRTSVHQHTTVRAMLCRPTVHIKGVWNLDLGWGCGYRNALMSLSSLLSNPVYQPLFSRENNGAEPGIRRVQGWIEEAWNEGYDPDGRDQLGGKVLGRRKWIGPSDLYALFSYKGIPCRLYDFPKPSRETEGNKAAHVQLQQWVRAYFGGEVAERDSGDRSVSGAMKCSNENGEGRAEDVQISNRYPLILQHSGHSRTIVGYEENDRGDINLLLFDPGRNVPKEVRAAGIAQLSEERSKFPLPSPPPAVPVSSSPFQSHSQQNVERPVKLQKKSSSQSRIDRAYESRPFTPPFMDGRSEVIDVEAAVVEDLGHLRGGGDNGPAQDASRAINGQSYAPPLEEDEEITASGWVRKKRALIKAKAKGGKPLSDPVSRAEVLKTLNHFVVNLGHLSKHTEYQILMFTGGPVLTESERQMRKIITSTTIRE